MLKFMSQVLSVSIAKFSYLEQSFVTEGGFGFWGFCGLKARKVKRVRKEAEAMTTEHLLGQ